MDLLLNACEKLEKVWDYARGELRENVSRKDLGRAMAAVDLLNDSDLKGDDFDLAQLLSQTVKKAAAAYTLERGDSIPEGVPGNPIQLCLDHGKISIQIQCTYFNPVSAHTILVLRIDVLIRLSVQQNP